MPNATDESSSSTTTVATVETPAANTNLLNVYQGAALLTADCLGTGILALPADISLLGWAGVVFLLAQGPINLYAGTILCYSARRVEEGVQPTTATCSEGGVVYQMGAATTAATATVRNDTETAGTDDHPQSELEESTTTSSTEKEHHSVASLPSAKKATTTRSSLSRRTTKYESIAAEQANQTDGTIIIEHFEDEHATATPTNHDDTLTFDFIGMTRALYPTHRFANMLVLSIYYCNIFLVLGDYILVMSHAVAAMLGDDICIPTAGLLASTLMFGLAQLRTMANLGRSASIISLLCLFIVVAQCLVSLHFGTTRRRLEQDEEVLPKFSALASIGFAVGSQKLLLNIRHEMKHRLEAPKSLAMSLTFYVLSYVAISILAGPNPPSFLFDAIPPGWNRRLGGLLLWIHVAVSYAINSQAICSSMDRILFGNATSALRWACLTLCMSISSYLVANAIPFFKDLVSLIGALTSIPLTLALPAIFYRRVFGAKTLSWSVGLLLFSILFTLCGLLGAVSEIDLDWRNQKTPFACGE